MDQALGFVPGKLTETTSKIDTFPGLDNSNIVLVNHDTLRDLCEICIGKFYIKVRVSNVWK